MLSESLRPLTQFNQFILYKLVFNPDKNKNDKIPIDPAGYTTSPTDPNNWMSYDEAAAIADMIGADGVAFVFMPQDPFFFIDIDNCAGPDGNWTPEALELLNRFNGAAVEVSQSGHGLHIIGVGECTDERKCKSPDDVFDLYTQYRFVALTDKNTIGNAAHDCGAQLRQLVTDFLTLDQNTLAAQWTTEPVDGHTVIEDDAELLRRAYAQRDANSVFNGKSKFQALFECDEQLLTQWYPHDSSPDTFDHSKADAALCSSLAFWTGKNCERIDRLFRESALHRPEKWDKRPKYAQETILRSVQNCSNVYSNTKREIELPTGSRIKLKDADAAYMYPEEQIKYFEGCTYITNADAIYTPSGQLLNKSRFNSFYGGYWFLMDHGNETKTRNAWEAFTLSQAYQKPVADRLCFRPDLPFNCEIEQGGQTMINSYKPIDIPMAQGDAGPLLEHLKRLLPDERDREILLCYMAAIVQFPGIKFKWTPLIQGTEGNGKTTFINIIKYCVGSIYTFLPNAKHLDNPFNAWLDRKLFIGVEEVKVNHRLDVLESLKPMISNDEIEIQYKGQDQTMADNRANFMMCSNYKDAIPVTVDTRRYCIFYTAQQSKQDKMSHGLTSAYFRWLYDWLENYKGYEVCHWFLMTYPINPEFNPASECIEAPTTSSSEEAVVNSLGFIEQHILEAASEGRPGFKSGWISSIALSQLLAQINKRVAPNKRGEMLEQIGYVKHPVLDRGIPSRGLVCVPDAGRRPTLYILKHIADQMMDWERDQVIRAYEEAQTAQ